MFFLVSLFNFLRRRASLSRAIGANSANGKLLGLTKIIRPFRTSSLLDLSDRGAELSLLILPLSLSRFLRLIWFTRRAFCALALNPHLTLSCLVE